MPPLASLGEYGAYDMGGNVDQWNEALIDGTLRGMRGGSFVYAGQLASWLAISTIRVGSFTSDFFG